jgi:DNA recombination-dependent growth factor C
MGLLSSTISMTRYRVEGKLEKPVLESVSRGLKENAYPEIEDDISDKTVGWTSFDKPFRPTFDGSSFVVGNYLVFSLRIDKKVISSRILKKYVAIEIDKRLRETGRDYLSRSERKAIKDAVASMLRARIPATPNIYDLIWSYEDSYLWFFSTVKSANEELEALFSGSFDLGLIRLFPYTTADMTSGLTDAQRDILVKLSPTVFAE